MPKVTQTFDSVQLPQITPRPLPALAWPGLPLLQAATPD